MKYKQRRHMRPCMIMSCRDRRSDAERLAFVLRNVAEKYQPPHLNSRPSTPLPKMRRNLTSSARSAVSVVRSGTSNAPLRAPFVCAHCRRIALQTSRSAGISRRRRFATAVPRHLQASTAEAPQLHRESIAPQTHYDIFTETFPNGPPPHSTFTPDLKQLRKEYLQLQAKSHPDLAPSSQKGHAEALSMRLNEAYKTIQDPLRRARYLLALRGIDVEDESAKTAENEMLMEVMEVREAVEEAEDEEQLAELKEENDLRIAQSVAILEEAFAKDDMQEAAQEAIRLRYWANIEESIQGWEKGQGGGILHH